MRWLDRLKQGLKKTSSILSFHSVDMEDIEDALIMADVGVDVTSELMQEIRTKKPGTVEEVKAILRQALLSKMQPLEHPFPTTSNKTEVILMVGVNGAGKTTTIGKLAAQYKAKGKSIACVAGDTFRAGAVEQLKKWADQVGADFYSGRTNCDAAGLIFDALKSACSKGTDVVFIDTAGRLQNRQDLMDELQKIVRVIRKVDPKMPHETILVLDATVGQNALQQVQAFQKVCDISGLVMTKLDGTAKGGVLIALSRMNIPIYAIGVGETLEDLNAFSATEYVDSVLGDK